MRKSTKLNLPLLLGSVFLAAFTNQHFATATTFERKLELSPIKMSRSDLIDLIDRLNSLVETANAKIPDQQTRQTFRLSRGNESLTKSGKVSIDSIVGGPEIATSFYYTIDSAETAAISKVSIHFSDAFREIEVTGTDSNQVSSLIATMKWETDKYLFWLGGSGLRLFGGLILLLIPFVIVINVDLSTFYTVLIFAVSNITLNIFPWSDWLPGTAIFRADASFIVREGPTIGAIGTLLGIIALIPTCTTLTKQKWLKP